MAVPRVLTLTRSLACSLADLLALPCRQEASLRPQKPLQHGSVAHRWYRVLLASPELTACRLAGLPGERSHENGAGPARLSAARGSSVELSRPPKGVDPNSWLAPLTTAARTQPRRRCEGRQGRYKQVSKKENPKRKTRTVRIPIGGTPPSNRSAALPACTPDRHVAS